MSQILDLNKLQSRVHVDLEEDKCRVIVWNEKITCDMYQNVNFDSIKYVKLFKRTIEVSPGPALQVCEGSLELIWNR